ncbi:MAG: domain protein AcuB [Deltaproteobacteria bacterium]|nr:domain protein AcuB [Deltaproteobacteria bacterium]
MPAISRYMTPQPWTIKRDASLREAHQLMHEHKIRHLPVFEDGQLVGVVTDRDLRLLEAVAHMDAASTHIEEAMSERPFIVTSDTPVDEVVQIMSEKKYGSVIVMGREGIEGIFTAVDACRVLAEVLQTVMMDTWKNEP